MKKFNLEELLILKGGYPSAYNFARENRIPDNQVYDWCRARYSPGFKMIVWLAKVLQVEEQLVIDAIKQTHLDHHKTIDKKV